MNIDPQWLEVVRLSGWYLLLLLFAELPYRRPGVNGLYIRHLLYSGMGLLALLLPLYLAEVWQAAALCAVLLFLLVSGRVFRWLPSLYEDPQEKGSLLIPPVLLTTFVFWYSLPEARLHYERNLFFFLPVLIPALSAPAAAIAGYLYRKSASTEGTEGPGAVASLTFFITTTLTCLVLFGAFRIPGTGAGRILTESLFIAAGTALMARFSRKGWDKLSVPLAVMGLLLLFERIR